MSGLSSEQRRVRVLVCTSCRRPDDPEDWPRPGAAFADRVGRAVTDLAGEAPETGAMPEVRRVRCLANCRRGLSAALGCDGAWSYVFGDLDPASDAPALVEGARLLAAAGDGLLPWRGRPSCLKRGLVARIPPPDFPGDPE